ncbi:M20/M25/M40 family metallo-hydrolase [Enterovirga sp.]|uniref:M20/M25/M40 family metallo-hydrolase n=1 Tax=Enterovirga sp. TaxID=2026350 RepID=UPI002C1947FA|nr:M20/M25/M40 family metallo-hydrolase [Enterovirga sp.]HMO28930.1 M20/M25/M40 family metallo-hydrolase [Enterovirga sp.]
MWEADLARTSVTLEGAIASAHAQQERSIGRLAEWVRIPSLTGEEGAAQAHMRAWMEAAGADIHQSEPDVEAMFAAYPDVAQYPTHWQHDLILPYADLPSFAALQASGLSNVLNYDGRPNLVGTWRGEGGGRSLILNGHVDTVTVEPRAAWTRDPFGAEIVDGLMYGRGTSDMKGGVMAALMAVTYLREAGIRLRGDVSLQSVVNEEHAGNGTLDLVRRGFRADAAVVLEPTSNTIAVSHPGGLYWQVSLTGVPRSPGARWNGTELEGLGAIDALPPVIEALLALEARYNAGTPRCQKAPFALTIGRVSGGHYETSSAAEAQLKGGAYFAPSLGSVTDVMANFRDAITEANRTDPRLRRHPAKLEFLHHDDATAQGVDHEIARVMGAVLAGRGADGIAHQGHFCCDMRHLVNQGGIPSIVFGPGSIAQAHKPDEHIPVADYVAAIEHLMAFIAEWCGVA